MSRKLITLFCLCFSLWNVIHQEAQAQETTFFIEEFDSVTPPALPAGWTDATMEWASSSSVSSTGSGLNNITIAGASAGAVQTPAIDLSGANAGTLKYLVRRTSTYEQDSLVVRASANGGASFTIVLLDKGAALPATDGSYEEISIVLPIELLGAPDVVIQFDALGGSTSGANIRIDDVTISGDGEGGGAQNVFGFSSDAGAADGTGLFEVPLLLDFTGPPELQGLQFEITWDAGAFTLTDVVRSAAISATEDWQLNYDARDGVLRGVLLGNHLNALSSGLYDPFMTLQFVVDAGNTASETVLNLSKAVGALALRTGDDAGLVIGQSTHTVSLTTGGAVFSADATEIDAGATGINTTSTRTLMVTNTGTADLVISEVVSSNALFSSDLGTATIVPGMEQAFIISFAPVFAEFGYQAGALTFTHNGSGGSNEIQVSGIGTGGRGDMNEDGIVDVVDVVLGIDYVLERTLPAAEQLLSADVFPFDAPDDLLDVRDLTVLTQAIVLDAWPDEIPLPVPAPTIAEAGKVAPIGIWLESEAANGETTLFLNLDVPVRAFQFAISSDRTAPVKSVAADLQAAGVHVQMYDDDASDIIRVLGARIDGSMVLPGRYAIVSWQQEAASDDMNLGYALAVDERGGRLPIGLTSETSTSSEPEQPEETFAIAAIYPNPFHRARAKALNVSVSLRIVQHVRMRVFDVLGREVAEVAHRVLSPGRHVLEWNGSDQMGAAVAPGLYLLRLETGDATSTRVVIVK